MGPTSAHTAVANRTHSFSKTSLGNLLLLQGTLVSAWRYFGCQNWRDVTGISWAQTKDAAKILHHTGQLPTVKNYWVLIVSHTKLRNPDGKENGPKDL